MNNYYHIPPPKETKQAPCFIGKLKGRFLSVTFLLSAGFSLLSMFLSSAFIRLAAKTFMVSISFYLLTPEAKSQSQVYVSISDKKSRLRFSTGESFLTDYCNVRKVKGKKELAKKSNPFYIEYKSKLEEIRDTLHRIEIDLKKKGKDSLENIREAYYVKIGKREGVSFTSIVDGFMAANESTWTHNRGRQIDIVVNHLKDFEADHGKINLETFSEETWRKLRDEHFAKRSNSSTNQYMSIFKQILKFARKKGHLNPSLDLDDLTYLDEVEPFKIALKEHEVETLSEMSLSERHGKVRDLFILEILTGQRFSDLPKILDTRHLSANSITIYQQKTNERVSIPLHPRLKKHLEYIKETYPEGLPVMTGENFNLNIKEICKEAGFTKEHSWVVLIGKKQVKKSDQRYNLVTSHTGRRTFCTLSLKRKISPEEIMRVTGHKNYDQFKAYIKVDDEDLETAYKVDLLK